MQFPHIRNGPQSGPSQSGLGAFYAANGLGQGPLRRSVSPIRAPGGAVNPPQMGMGVQYGGMPMPAPGGAGRFPPVQSAAGAAPPSMGAPPHAAAMMMGMQAQMMQKRRANMLLKQQALQQQQQQQQQQQSQQMQGGGARMGAKPWMPHHNHPGAQQQNNNPQQQSFDPTENGSNDSGGGGSSNPDPRHAAFDMGQKMAQMEQFMNEAKTEKEQLKREREEAVKQREQDLRDQVERGVDAKKNGKKKKKDKKDKSKEKEKEKENEKKKSSKGKDSEEQLGGDNSNADKNKKEEEDDDEDDDEPLEEEDINIIAKLEREVREKISENEKELRELAMTGDELRAAIDAAGKEEMREKFRDRMERAERKGKGKLPLMPLWRHRLAGNDKPPKERILKGLALLRAVSWGIVIMHVRPAISVRKRKRAYMEKEAAEFRRTLDAFCDACTTWWGFAIKIPVASLQEGSLGSLRPRKIGTFGKVTLQKKDLLCLKVRVRGISLAIKNARMPQPTLTSFLVELLSDDKYFYEGFLFAGEKNAFEFNDFGGTRGMVREIEVAEEKHVDVPCKKGQIVLGEKSQKKRKVDASRARLLLQNFVFIRILLNRCILSPWVARIGRKPKKQASKTYLDNLRVVGTVIYSALRMCNPDLPEVAPDLAARYQGKMEALDGIEFRDSQAGAAATAGGGGDSNKGGGGNNADGGAGEGDSRAIGNDGVEGVPGTAREKIMAEDDDDASIGSAATEQEDPDAAHTQGGMRSDLAPRKHYKEGTMMEYLFGPRTTAAEMEGRKRGPEDYLREDMLFGMQRMYPPLEQTTDSLLNMTEFVLVKGQIEEWAKEIAADLDEYTDRLLLHVLESREGVLHDEVHELVEGHEDAPEGEVTAEEAEAKKEALMTARKEEKEKAIEEAIKAREDAEKEKNEAAAASKMTARGGGDGSATARSISGPGVRVPAPPRVGKLDLDAAGLGS